MLAVGQRDDDGEFRSDTFFRFDGNRAVHQVHDAFRDGHSEAGTAVFGAAAAVLLGKGVENLRDKRLVYADARVPYAEFYGGMVAEYGCALNRHCNTAGGVRKLDRVGENVDESTCLSFMSSPM